MQFIKPGINIDFIGKRKFAYVLSLLLIGITIVVLSINKGPRYGIDFSGGTLIQVKFSGPVSPQQITSGLTAAGIENISVQSFGDSSGHEYLLRTDKQDDTTEGNTEKLRSALAEATGVDAEIRRMEMVGPQVGKDLREKASFAFFYALLFITIYISGRFEMKWILSAIMAGALMAAVYLLPMFFVYVMSLFKLDFQISIPLLIGAALLVTLVLFWILELKYAMGAIAALIHDVLITVGIFTLFGKEFTLPIVAALLTIVGYSLNDTIIVFDRIRENIRKVQKLPFDSMINRSINETLSRTLLTSGTTLLVLIALFVWGGGIIHDFAFTMIIGILVGTYSSVYVASPILLAWKEKNK